MAGGSDFTLRSKLKIIDSTGAEHYLNERFYTRTNSSDTAGRWTATINGITDLYDGLEITVYLTTNYSSTYYNMLNINGLGDKLVWWRKNARLTSHVGQYALITLVYNSDCGTISYNGTTYTGGWLMKTSYYESRPGILCSNSSPAYDANNVTSNALVYGYSNMPSTSAIVSGGNGFKSRDGALYAQSYSNAWVAQIAQDYRDGGLAVRGKNNGTWTNWLTILNSANYNSLCPKLDGTGATGNWHINADTADKLKVARNIIVNGQTQSFDGSANIEFAINVYGNGFSTYPTAQELGSSSLLNLNSYDLFRYRMGNYASYTLHLANLASLGILGKQYRIYFYGGSSTNPTATLTVTDGYNINTVFRIYQNKVSVLAFTKVEATKFVVDFVKEG
jgi:hypothetical protein